MKQQARQQLSATLLAFVKMAGEEVSNSLATIVARGVGIRPCRPGRCWLLWSFSSLTGPSPRVTLPPL